MEKKMLIEITHLPEDDHTWFVLVNGNSLGSWHLSSEAAWWEAKAIADHYQNIGYDVEITWGGEYL